MVKQQIQLAHLSLGGSLSMTEKEGRGDEIKRLTCTFDLRNSFRLRFLSHTYLLPAPRVDVTLVNVISCIHVQVFPLQKY